jgi:hypothetical protein
MGTILPPFARSDIVNEALPRKRAASMRGRANPGRGESEEENQVEEGKPREETRTRTRNPQSGGGPAGADG